MVRRGLRAHGKLMLHAGRAEGPHGASTLAAELARHGGRRRCLPRLQHGHRGVEARLLQEAGKVSRDLLRGKWHHLAGVEGRHLRIITHTPQNICIQTIGLLNLRLHDTYKMLHLGLAKTQPARSS